METGWVGGWVDGWKSRVKDCLQQSKIVIHFSDWNLSSLMTDMWIGDTLQRQFVQMPQVQMSQARIKEFVHKMSKIQNQIVICQQTQFPLEKKVKF